MHEYCKGWGQRRFHEHPNAPGDIYHFKRSVGNADNRGFLGQKKNIYSQNGEDGIIAALFELIGTTTKACCEFGAWDGIHFSNCRNLILGGWSAVMIESDERRFKELVSTYAAHPSVTCVNTLVDTGRNSLGEILKAHQTPPLDFLSVDIDGLDYEIFETLDVRPRVICIEVSSGHDPECGRRIGREIAQHNVGQPLQVFVQIADARGYDLVCYSGNAFFVRRDVMAAGSLTSLTSAQAYRQFLDHSSASEKEWMYLVNRGLVTPRHRHANPHLTAPALGISRTRAAWLRTSQGILEPVRSAGRTMRKLLQP